MRRVIVILVALALTVAPAACGGSSNGSTAAGGAKAATYSSGTATTPPDKIKFAKTKFVLHAGLALGAFHRYIYKPFKSGKFQSSHGLRRAAILAKAGVAGLFAYHELKLAQKDVRASPALSKLFSPISAAAARLQALGNSLRHGKLDPRAIEQANGMLGTLGRAGAQAGAPVKDVAPPANLRPTG